MALTSRGKKPQKLKIHWPPKRPHLGAFYYFRRPLLLGIMLRAATDQRNHAAIFLFAGDFSRRRTATSDAFFQSVLVSLVNLSFTSSLSGWWIAPDARPDPAGTTCNSSLLHWSVVLSHPRSGWQFDFCDELRRRSRLWQWSGLLVIISEIYPTKVRGRGMSIAVTASGWWGTWETSYFPSCRNIGIRWHFLVFQRRRTVDGRSGRMADSRNQRPFARRDHKILDGEKSSRRNKRQHKATRGMRRGRRSSAPS